MALRHWKGLIGRFLGDGWRVILVGGPDDVAIGASIGRHERLRDWTGQLRLTETAALLERADFFIGSDSGPAHVAASAGIPSVVLFSGTNRPRQWRPWSRRTMIVRNRVACRPCHQKVCPLADHPCMTGITPDRVYRASLRWWAGFIARNRPMPRSDAIPDRLAGLDLARLDGRVRHALRPDDPQGKGPRPLARISGGG